jgi:excinuclease UvrABC helicase subunit UvrB
MEAADLCHHYATEVADRLSLEQYRPYIIMMNRRAAALRLLQQGKPGKAVEAIDEGIQQIQHFFEEYNHAEASEDAREIGILRTLRREIADKMPTRRLESLQQQLLEAVQGERYEEAANLRDQINKLIDRRQRQKSENPQ